MQRSPTIEEVPETLPKLSAQDLAAQFEKPTERWDPPELLRLWHLASFDAPTVALVWSLAFAWICRARIPVWILAVLGMTVWVIYVADRLLDARRALKANDLARLRERHFFHWRHRHILAPAAVAAAVSATLIVFSRMSAAIFAKDSVVALAALVYMRGVHLPSLARQSRPTWLSRVLTKECLVGILFAAGCALPAWNRAASPAVPLISVAIFAALAWLDCHAIDRWETRSRMNRANEVITPALFLALAGTSLSFLSAAFNPRAAAMMLAAASSALLLATLDRVQSRLAPIALRALADLVLLTPLAMLVR